MRIADNTADLGRGLDYYRRPAVFDDTVVCSADDAADLIVSEHLAGNAEVSYCAAPALTEETRHVNKVGDKIQTCDRVAAAVKVSAEIGDRGYALVVIERCSDGNPARALRVKSLSCYVYVVRKIEVCLFGRIAFLDIL